MRKKVNHCGNEDIGVAGPLSMTKSRKTRRNEAKLLAKGRDKLTTPVSPTVNAGDSSISGIAFIPKFSNYSNPNIRPEFQTN